MIFVYILKSEIDSSYYVGMSENPERRLIEEHNEKRVKSTKSKVPWRIIYKEEHENRPAARLREKYLKSAAGRKFRKKLGM